MRTVTGAETTLLQGAHLATFARVLVEDADGTYQDLTDQDSLDWVHSGRIDQTIDQIVATGQFTFWRSQEGGNSLAPLDEDSLLNRDSGASYAPLIDVGRGIRCEFATVAIGSSPGGSDWQRVFDGTIDEWAVSNDFVNVSARDSLGAEIADSFVEAETSYGTGPGRAIEDVMQDILTAWTGITLYTPASPSFVVTTYNQQRTSVLEALQQLAALIGWVVQPRWDDGTSSFRLTFFDPVRAPVSTDWTWATNRYEQVPNFRLSRLDVRNALSLWYTKASDGVRSQVTASDATSITKYDRQWMEIEEPSDSPIDTETEAQDMLDNALLDLKDPVANQEIKTLCFWPIEISDYYQFNTNDVHYTTNQSFGVTGFRREFAGGHVDTFIRTRGKPAGFVTPWIVRGGTIKSGQIDAAQAAAAAAARAKSFNSSVVFAADDQDTVSWGAGTLTRVNDSFSIDAGDTGNMTLDTWIYLDPAVSITVLQTSTTPADAVGDDKVIVCFAQKATNAGQNAHFNSIFGTLAINEDQVGPDSIPTIALQDLSIVEAKLAALAVTTAKLDALAVTTAKIAADAVTAGEIAASAVGTSEIAALAVTVAEIGAAAVETAKIAALAVTDAELAANSVTTVKIAALAVTAAEIAANTITAAKIAALTITSAELAAGSVIAGKIAALSIVAGDIAAATITGAKLVANTITATQIAAGTVTAAEIAAGTVTAAELAANSVNTSELVAGSVTSAEIAALTIVAGDIAANTITASQIAANAITTSELNANSVTSAKINVSTLSAITANLGTVTAGTLNAAVVVASESFTAATVTLSGTTGLVVTNKSKLDGHTSMGGIVVSTASVLIMLQPLTASKVIEMQHSHATVPRGMQIAYIASAPNSTNNEFLQFNDNVQNRTLVWSNGDIDNNNNSYSGFSDRKMKQDIEDVDANAEGGSYEDFLAIQFKKFRWKNEVATDGDDARVMLGVIAQELQAISPGLVSSKVLPSIEPGSNSYDAVPTLSTRYSILYMKGMVALQENMRRTVALEVWRPTAEADITDLKRRVTDLELLAA